MEPAVRGARIEPTIVVTRLETAFFASQDSELPNRQTAFCHSKRCRRERNFWTQRPVAKNPPERPLSSAETGKVENWRQDPTQKRPLFDRRRFPRFEKIGWWRRSGPKLHAPHAVIEPVSEPRARNGIFCCRDGSANSAVPPLRDRYRDAQRFEKAPFWRD